ncbi:MAG TPA: hypothetical protein VG309_01195 [Rhizomicrobium sp.]|jgi:hypothetical protein|nr:hypothetical protein [Rhizomicrobium sp.]
MKTTVLLIALTITGIASASAADDVALQRMALCQDSWFDWQKSDPAKLKAFGERFRTQFQDRQNQPYFLPKSKMSVAGLRVEQAFPDSVGMGVGFSLTVDAPFDVARTTMEKTLGRKLQQCEASDGMHSCALDIADKRSFTIMAMDNEKSRTLVGCYYFYEK